MKWQIICNIATTQYIVSLAMFIVLIIQCDENSIKD